MTRRTKTYIAADWEGDHEAVDKLYHWRESDYWSLDFIDAHDLCQARDTSLNCSIKRSLKTRLDVSKTFVLIVGDHTRTLASGSCYRCASYSSWSRSCGRGHSVDPRSFVQYECETALSDDMRIIVLYNTIVADRSRCPECLREVGKHVAMKRWVSGRVEWDYLAVKDAFA